ncbi:hypothetical protein [Seleniivibrio woodruffii]|uniref:hypothetical protein n=1 Tax=Seleniivibrio woodruffii TaxID=1078050 RepID=UPI00240A048C|nr:hypothetical protein [Seleniivibrio woodruffii]
MRLFIVSCDFKNDLNIESKITGELNKHDGVRFKKDAWLLRTEATSEDIYLSVLSHLRPETCIIIAEVLQEPHYHMPQGITSWIKRNPAV